MVMITVKSADFVTFFEQIIFFRQKYHLRWPYVFVSLVESYLISEARCWHCIFLGLTNIQNPIFYQTSSGDETSGLSANFVTPLSVSLIPDGNKQFLKVSNIYFVITRLWDLGNYHCNTIFGAITFTREKYFTKKCFFTKFRLLGNSKISLLQLRKILRQPLAK
jgi:hypothetical protein